MSFNIAIDGPAGAGKSTIARKAAQLLGFVYVDTGAMYRAMALHLLRLQVSEDDQAAISLHCADALVTIEYSGGEQIVLLNGENVNGLIRTEEVSHMASRSSANADVRARLLDLQKFLAAGADVIMDGRDIGTNVLPDADVKIFLTAGSTIRARRRYEELRAKGAECSLEAIEREIVNRDQNDMTRAVSPLKQAFDAVLVDTSDMNIEQAVQAVLDICKEKGCVQVYGSSAG